MAGQQPQSGDFLDRVGRWFLAADVRYYAILLLIGYVIWVGREAKAGTLTRDRAVTGVMVLVLTATGIISALNLLCVTVLTNPPAIDALTRGELMFTGFSSSAISIVFAAAELVGWYRRSNGQRSE